jgi:hypothetical protein
MADVPQFDESMLPTGYDRAGDGTTVWGTPSSALGIIVDSADGPGLISTEELPDSPEIERAEQTTVTHRFMCSPTDAWTWSETLYRGVVMADSSGNLVKVLSSKIQAQKGGSYLVTVIGEFLNLDVPPDEFDLSTTQLNIDILKHPRYFFALNPEAENNTIEIQLGDFFYYPSISSVQQSIIRSIQTYRDSPFFPSADNINGLIQNNIWSQLNGNSIDVNLPNENFDDTLAPVDPVRLTETTPSSEANCRYFIISVPADDPKIKMAQAAANEIIQKIWRCEDTPYIAGYQITWSSFSTISPSINPGGYIEDPYDAGNINQVTGEVVAVSSPELPDYFYSSTYPANPSKTIFDDLPVLNPTCYSDDGTENGNYSISWLRQADTVHFDRTFYKITRTWIGSPVGHWDADLYSQYNRPTSAEDYNILPY